MKNRAGTPGDGPRPHREAQKKAWIPALGLAISLLCVGVGIAGFIFNERSAIDQTKLWNDYTKAIKVVDKPEIVDKDFDGLPVTFHGLPGGVDNLAYKATDPDGNAYFMKEGSGPALALRTVVESYDEKQDLWAQVEKATAETMNMRTQWQFSLKSRVGKYFTCPPDSDVLTQKKDNPVS